MRHLFLFLLIASLIYSCKSESTESKGETEEIITEVVDTLAEKTPEDELIWAIYEGNIGLYGSHVIMELGISGNKVKGSYFYTKHQKEIQLEGEMDPVTNEIFAEEKYKGKTTGYMKFTLIKGELEGQWMKSLSSDEPEEFQGRLIKDFTDSKDSYSPQHLKYENQHTVSFYDGMEDYEEDVIDYLTLTKVNDDYLSVYVNVTCSNGHSGTIDGLAKMVDSTNAILLGEDECKLRIKFFEENGKKKASIDDEYSCRYYYGARAYFGQTFTQVD